MRLRLLAALSCAAFLAPALIAQTAQTPQTLTFDDLTTALTAVPNGYDGFNFNNFDVNTLSNEGLSGYVNGTVSPSSVIYNGFGNPANFSSANGLNFQLSSFDLTAAINDDLTVTVQGLENGVLLDTATFNVSTFGPTLESLGWSGINQVNFTSGGGVPDPNAVASGYGGTELVLDNVTVNGPAATVTPEPSSLALFGTGVAGVAGVLRKRFRQGGRTSRRLIGA